MAYSSTDLANLETAINKLVAGDRIVEVSIDGDTTKYGQVDLDKLINLRSQMQKEVASSSGKFTFGVASTSKGL